MDEEDRMIELVDDIVERILEADLDGQAEVLENDLDEIFNRVRVELRVRLDVG